jgi:septal ring factor EnvC (AmiA/AmiB activator)
MKSQMLAGYPMVIYSFTSKQIEETENFNDIKMSEEELRTELYVLQNENEQLELKIDILEEKISELKQIIEHKNKAKNKKIQEKKHKQKKTKKKEPKENMIVNTFTQQLNFNFMY